MSQHEHTAHAERILSFQEASKRVSLGKSRLYELIAAGEFAPLLQVSKGRVGFRERDIDAWIRSRPLVEHCGRFPKTARSITGPGE